MQAHKVYKCGPLFESLITCVLQLPANYVSTCTPLQCIPPCTCVYFLFIHFSVCSFVRLVCLFVHLVCLFVFFCLFVLFCFFFCFFFCLFCFVCLFFSQKTNHELKCVVIFFKTKNCLWVTNKRVFCLLLIIFFWIFTAPARGEVILYSKAKYVRN